MIKFCRFPAFFSVFFHFFSLVKIKFSDSGRRIGRKKELGREEKTWRKDGDKTEIRPSDSY